MKFRRPFEGVALLAAIFLLSCRQHVSVNSSFFTKSDSLFVNHKKFITFPDSKKIQPQWSEKNTVVALIISEPDNLHPANGNSAVRKFINNYLHGFAVGYDMENFTVRPGVVKSLPEISSDELQYTYEIREEVRWDDGAPLTADDILFTLKANKCPLVNNAFTKPVLENINDILLYPGNNRKFTLNMKKKYIQNITFLRDIPVMQRSFYDSGNILAKYSIQRFDSPGFNPLAHDDLKKWADDFNDYKYGSEPAFIHGLGAYRVAAWDAGESITLSKKKEHWTQKLNNPCEYETAYPEKIIFKIVKDRTAQVLEFKSQNIDVATNLSAETLFQLRSDSGFNANYYSAAVPTFNYTYIALNIEPDGIRHKSLFTDKRVRRAMAHLTPADDIIRIVKKGTAVRMTGPVCPLKDDYNSRLVPVPYDVGTAKKMLEEAGWEDTDDDGIADKKMDGIKTKFRCELLYMNSQPEWNDIATMIAESMREAGVEVNLKAVDAALLYEKARQHDFDILLGAWTISSAPDDHAQLWHTQSWVTNGSNFTGFGNARTDALIDSLNAITGLPLRTPLSYRFQQIVYEEQPYIFLTLNTRKTVIHKRFGNAAMYIENPGVILNNLRVLSKAGSNE